MGTPVIFFTTFARKEDALEFARKAVGEKLAACVNVLDSITSVYFWESKVNEESEVLAVGKTTQEKFSVLKSRLKEWHPYTVPELISLRIDDGHAPYLEWISQTCK